MSGGFDALGLMPELLQAISDLGFLLPTDIQDEAIPLILGGGDVMAAAETGSGKTAAFCLPIIQSVHERLVSLAQPNDPKGKGGRAERNSICLSQTDKDTGLEVDESGLSCDSTATADVYCGARATHGVKSGRYFFECIVSGSGICRVGWSTVAAHLELGKDKHGYGYGSTGFKSSGGFEKYGDGKFQNGDAIGCYLDLANKEVSYSRNGVHLGKAFDIPAEMIGSVFFPAVLLKNSELVINFGEHPFKFQPSLPKYTAISKAPVDQLVSATSKAAFVSTGKRKPLALIIEPTRDLAEQVYQALKDFTKYVRQPALQCAIATGGGENPGAGEGKIEKRLKEGVDILVGTMGKLSGLVKSGALDLSNIRFFVLDEADRLLSNDSLDAVMELFNKCPGGGTGQHRLQVCFFSATLHSPEIKRLSEQVCQNPTWVDLKGTDTVPSTVHHVVVRVNPAKDQHYLVAAPHPAVTDGMHLTGAGNKKRALGADCTREERSQALKEIKQHLLVKLIDQYEMSQCIVFCRTNVDCNALEQYLNSYSAGGGKQGFRGKVESGKENKYSCCVLAGMRSMEERRTSLQALKDGDVRILICTDVAARGIDIEGLPYVINMTLPPPESAEDYIHRIGRVGRADRMGLAFSIVAANGVGEQVWYHKCANRGKNCENRRLVEQGGCRLWYDEGMCLAKVEKLLNQRISELEPDLALPPVLRELNIKYGEDAKQSEQQTSVHVEQLSAGVRELAVMELRAQNAFLLMGSRTWT